MARIKILRRFTQGKHRHSTCVSTALHTAEKTCHARGNRFTPIRRRVLELVWGSHEPVKAYDVLQSLQQEHKGAAPPTVYRALDFLLEEGLVHKIESLNAYVGCGRPGHRDAGQFLICAGCGEVAELDDPELAELIAKKAARLGFAIEDKVIELTGSCAECRSSA